MGTGKSLFQDTVERALNLGVEGHIVVVTHRDHGSEIIRQWESIRPVREESRPLVILEEPIARNTAPALAYAAVFLEQNGDPQATMIILPSDHLIEHSAAFKEDAEKAHSLADEGYLVSFGISPRGPDTGYGYIETGPECSPGYLVASFHEKPDLKTAKGYLEKGNFYWNAGIFTFKVKAFMEAMLKDAPEVAKRFTELNLKMEEKRSVLVCRNPEAVAEVYGELPSISVDYAVMEKSRKSALVPASFRWSDVGSWDEVCRYYDLPEENVFQADSKDNFIYSDIPVALAGVKDLIVVIKDGAALVCKKGSSQLVRELVQELQKKKREDLL
jgi:mannose-1-phosphate guanylyltransferase/mannose-6-phosphate isomerase